MVYFCTVLSFYKHIESLLVRNDYVVVPGLGGFALQLDAAYIHEGKIYPPLQTICFNPLMKQPDGLLAIEISRKENVSYRKAVEQIDNELKSFFSELEISGNVSFGVIGIFYRSGGGTLIFEPSTVAGFLPQNIGMQPLTIHTEQHKKEVLTVRFKKRKILQYAAVVALLLGLLFVSPHLNDVQYQHTAVLLPLKTAALTFIDTVVKADPTVADNCPELRKDTLEHQIVVTNDKELYHVIIACWESQNRADKCCEQLKKDGYECAHVVPDRKYRVSIQSFKSRKEAIEYMENIRQTDKRFESAWVLCK